MTKDLSTTAKIGEVRSPIPIASNGKRTCLFCGVPITCENDSGWEMFASPRTTQPVCVPCKAAQDVPGEKVE